VVEREVKELIKLMANKLSVLRKGYGYTNTTDNVMVKSNTCLNILAQNFTGSILIILESS